MVELSKKWQDITWIGFDTETTGKYPLEAELCEVAAVAWRNGQVVDTFQSLIQPSQPMGEEVIRIHHITNEMVASAPTIASVLPELLRFLSQGIVIAHHAPFDMGFLAVEIEKYHHPLLEKPVVCSSRLARKVMTESHNHKLQTLVARLKLDPGQAHRALSDAKNALSVALHCFERMGQDKRLSDILSLQGGALEWEQYSVETLRESQILARLVEAIAQHREVLMTYEAGSKPGQARAVLPKGIVRNPDGDFLVASDEVKGIVKRYLLSKISRVE